MLNLLDRAYWWIGLRLLALIGCLVLMSGAAQAKCKKGLSPTVRRSATQVEYACQDKKGLWQGLVIAKTTKGELLSVGKYKDGKPDGTWSIFDGRGHIVASPVYKDGVLVASDSMKDEESDDGGGGE